jgi:hypothetical protein
LNDALDIVDAGNRNMETPRSRRVIGHVTHWPVNSLKTRGESTSAGRLPACSLAMDWRKSSQMMSPTSGP